MSAGGPAGDASTPHGSAEARAGLDGVPACFAAFAYVRGGESDVYFCRDTRRGDARVAVKVYVEGFEPDGDVLARRQRLQHPGVQSLLEHGRTGHGRFFEVLEYAPGGSLQEALPFEEDALVGLVLPQVLEALSYCHRQGIVHRDVKPSNLLFPDERRTRILLSDFGLASLTGPRTTRFTERGGASFQYAAPEVLIDPRTVSPRSDYFALGMTLDSLLRGTEYGSLLEAGAFGHLKLRGRLEPPAFASERMRQLLRGLWCPNPELRWGEAQVREWLAGRPVPVPRHDGSSFPAETYTLGDGVVATSVQELARHLLENPEKARQHIGMRMVEDWLVGRDQSLAVKLRQIRLASASDEACVVESLHTLDPTLPLVLPEGIRAGSGRDLARQIDRNRRSWEAGRQALFDSRIMGWMRATGQSALLDVWNAEADRYADPDVQDAGLERFLHILDPDLRAPALHVSPPRLDFGEIVGDRGDRRLLRLVNSGRGFVSGVLTPEDAVREVSVAPQFFRLFPGEATAVEVTVDTSGLQRGVRHATKVAIASNTGSERSVEIAYRVAYPRAALIARTVGFGMAGFALAAAYRLVVGGVNGRRPTDWLAAGASPPSAPFEFAALTLALVAWLVVRMRRRP